MDAKSEGHRVAILVSGALRSGNPRGATAGNPKGCLIRNNKVLRSKFPDADFYYATWDGYKEEFERLFPNEKCEFFDEPDIHYHPYLGIDEDDHLSDMYTRQVKWASMGGDERVEWTSHHTKQILIHSWLLNKVKDKYDVIVRTRFDCFVSKKADFHSYVADTHNNNRANCFGTTSPQKFDDLTIIKDEKWSVRIIDQLIIHNANVIDNDNVEILHKEKKLHAAEFGWYQVISMPHGSNHINHTGWVNPDWSVLSKFLYEIT